MREELAPRWDALVWMQDDFDEQERFVAVRDGDSPEQRERALRTACWRNCRSSSPPHGNSPGPEPA
jgi:hypothetical protein